MLLHPPDGLAFAPASLLHRRQNPLRQMPSCLCTGTTRGAVAQGALQDRAPERQTRRGMQRRVAAAREYGRPPWSSWSSSDEGAGAVIESWPHEDACIGAADRIP